MKKSFFLIFNNADKKKVKAQLDKGEYLSENERKIRSTLEKSLVELDVLFKDFRVKVDKFAQAQIDHFADLKRNIEMRRHSLKSKIDSIAQDMLKRVDECQLMYKRNLVDKQLDRLDFDSDIEQNLLANSFRDAQLSIQQIRYIIY